MSSLFDDAMMGTKVANALFKGAKKFGKIAADGIQKVNESEKFQNLKTDIQNRVANSETLNTVRTELQQRISQITTVQPTSAKKYCVQCGESLDKAAKFCSNCGAAQETIPVEENTVPAEPEDVEALPTVLENDHEEIPDIFGFQPGHSEPAKAIVSRRNRAMEYVPGKKNIEPYAGKYHLDNPGFDLDMYIYQEKNELCVSYYDHIDTSTHVYRFDDWGCGKNLLYGIAQDYSFKFIFQEDGRLELDTYEVFPDLSGLYRCLD